MSGFLNQANWSCNSHFRANQICKVSSQLQQSHIFVRSLYSLAISVPDPLSFYIFLFNYLVYTGTLVIVACSFVL